MGTMNVSLPDTLREFVEAQVGRAGYGTSRQYVRELIRRDQERLQFRDLLLAGARSPIAGEADAAYFDGLRKKAGSRAARKATKA